MRIATAITTVLLSLILFTGSPAEGATPLRRAVCFVKHRVHIRHSCPRSCRCQPNQRSEKDRKLNALLDRGEALREKGDFDGAIAAFDEAIKLDDQCAEAYCGRGRAFGQKGNIAAARADLNEAIRLNPQNASAFNARGCIYGDTDYDKALADFNEAIKLDPTLAGAYENRALVYFYKDELPNAIADFTDAIHFEPSEPKNYMKRAFCYIQMGQFAKATSDYDVVVKLVPNEPFYREIRAALFIYQGDYNRALADFQTMMKLNPQDPAAHFESAKKHPLDEKDLEHGERQVRQMLENRPAMGELGAKADSLYRWAARKFAGEDLGERIFWNPGEPPPEVACDHRTPGPGCPGYIQMHEKFTQGPLKGKNVPFEELWRGAVFELYNITGAKDFKRIESEAAAGKISREEYITGTLAVESRAAAKTRAFYIRVFLPWAKEYGVKTDPRKWCVARREKIGDDFALSLTGKDSAHWRHYGYAYDIISFHSLTEKGKYEEARLLAEQMRKQAATKEEQANVYFASGYCRAMMEDYRQALADYGEAIRLDPKNGTVFCARGGLYYSHGDYDRAIADFAEAIRVDPELMDSVKPYLLYAYRKRGQARTGKGDWKGAIADFSAAIRLDPADAGTFHYRGVVHVCKRDYAKAKGDLTEAIRLDPKQEGAYFIRAWACYSQGDLDQGIADFQATIRLAPDRAGDVSPYLVPAYLQRAKSHSDRHDWDRAVADLKEAQRLNSLYPASNAPPAFGRSDSEDRRPDTDILKATVPPSDYHYTGDALRSEAQKPKARAAPPNRSTIAPFEIIPPGGWDPNPGLSPRGIPIAAELPMPDNRPQTSDANFFGHDVHPRPAAADQNLAGEIASRLIDAYLGRSADFAAKNESGKAIADLTAALDLDPKRYSVLIERGILLRKKGDYDKAIADFNAAIRAKYFPCGAYLNRGTAYYEKGDLDAAVADFTEAIRLNRYAPYMALCRRADARLKKSDLKAALNDANAAIENNSNCAEAYRCRGRVQRRLGKKDEADRDFKEAERLRENHGSY